MKRILTFLLLVLTGFFLPAFADIRNSKQSLLLNLGNKRSSEKQQVINLGLVGNAPEDKYANMNYGVKLLFRDDRSNSNIIQVYDASASQIPDVSTNPTIQKFVPYAVRQYMSTMGFVMDSDPSTDYIMEVTLNEFHCDYLSGLGWTGVVMMSIKVLDHTQKLVYPSTEVEGRISEKGNAKDFDIGSNVINQAMLSALQDIEWDRIAFYLHKTQTGNKDTEEEKVKKTPIFWSIDSRPQGADIYWRISSSTDEVKNQNSKHLGTTQYEATEALNIKGLTYNNASEVEIVIKCEKEGYMPQTKKVSVSSALDEKEILMFFKLVKMEE